MRLPYAYPKTSKRIKAKTYAASFRKQNTNELKTGKFQVVGGQLKGVINTFRGYGWDLIRIKEI